MEVIIKEEGSDKAEVENNHAKKRNWGALRALWDGKVEVSNVQEEWMLECLSQTLTYGCKILLCLG